MRLFLPWAIPVLLAGMIPACGGASTPAETAANADTKAADADVYPVNRSKVRGALRFVATDKGLELRGHLSGLIAGKYGFGVRDGTDCGPNGSTAGSYLEGGNKAAPLGHLDDLLIQKTEGTNVTRVEPKLKLSGPNSIVGHTLVIEAWPTDPKVDPTTVPIVGCGVIQPE